MGFHTFDPAETDRLEDPTRFRFCSREELLQEVPRGSDTRILDVGSGTGFYTDELAPFVGELVALDLQPAMHHQYRERGLPATVSPVTADAERLPFAENSFDGAVSTMTVHESGSEASFGELARVLAPDGRFVAVDWSRNGDGEAGPPLAERYTAEQVVAFLESAGFAIDRAVERSETFQVVATVHS